MRLLKSNRQASIKTAVEKKNSALKTGQKIFTTTVILQKGSGKIPVAMTATPIIYNGETIGAVGVFRDVTHEKEVDRMKTEFISLASHQLRTPLSAIKCFCEMLLNGDTAATSARSAGFEGKILFKKTSSKINATITPKAFIFLLV